MSGPCLNGDGIPVTIPGRQAYKQSDKTQTSKDPDMKSVRIFLLLASIVPLAAGAAVNSGDLPGGTVWYLHANLAQMRSTKSASPLYNWFEAEVLGDINDDFGIELDEEVDSVTAFSTDGLGTVILIDGRLSQELRDQLLGKIKGEVSVTEARHDGRKYYFARNDEQVAESNNDPFDDFKDAVYFSFDISKKLIVTSREEQMKALLNSGGKIAGAGSVDGAMFVLTADKSFVQAGLRPDGLADDGEDSWESNIIRNTKQAALLISDSDGRVAVEAQLISADPKMAQSIGGIVNGLISLQAFNTELGPELQSLIQNTRVTVKENTLSISTVVDAEQIVNLIDD
jgi:hypothetical protein